MHVVIPDVEEMLRIQDWEGAFYFSGAFATVLAKYGIVSSEQGPIGPGIVTRGYSSLATLDMLRPHFFEGPLSDDILESQNLEVDRMTIAEGLLSDGAGCQFSQIQYMSHLVRDIPPVGTKVAPEIVPYQPDDTRWNCDRFDIQIFPDQAGAEPILTITLADGASHVVGVKKGRHIFLGIPVLDVIMQHHAFPPIEGTAFYSADKSIVPAAMEKWLFETMKALAESDNCPYLRVGIWPCGYKAALTIRHDVDRPTDRGPIEDLLRFYNDHGVKSTWFWRCCRAHKELMTLVCDFDQEVSLHTEVNSEVEMRTDELGFFSREFGFEMCGYTAHGGRGSYGYLGQRQYEWAISNGLQYGELIGVNIGLPFTAPVVHADLLQVTDLWLPGTHYSIDLGMSPDAYDIEGPRNWAIQRFVDGEQAVIMNHPDIHLDELKQLIAKVNLDDIWCVTVLDSIRWCRQRSGIRAELISEGKFAVTRSCELDHNVEVWLEGVPGGGEEFRHCLSADFESVILSADQKTEVAVI